METDLYLVDSSAWIEFLRPHGSPAIRGHVASLISSDRVFTTAIIKAEVLQGAKTQKDYENLEKRLGAVRYHPFDETLWPRVFRISFEMRRKGYGVPVTDVIIAVSAMSEGATVLHADKHFDELSKVMGLKATSYVSALRK